MARVDKQDINKSVSSFYSDVAEGKEGVRVDSIDLARSLGYSEEDIASIPEEANVGLGCGNPLNYAKVQEGETILDLGCGKGMDVFNAAKYVGESGRVIGVDMTPKMLETARKIKAKRGFVNTEFRLGEIEHLPVADNSVDLVISNCVINLSTDKAQVYKEILRVLKPGGRISVSDIVHIHQLPDSVMDNPKMYGTCVAGGMFVPEKKDLLEEAGFEKIDIHVEKITAEYAKKWGIDEVALEDFVASSNTVAFKPE